MNPVDLSPVGFETSLWSLFWGAHIVVKAVMLGLLSASIWCWAIIIDKTLLFARAERTMDRFEETFWSGQSLEDLHIFLTQRPSQDWGAMASVFMAAMGEWKRSLEGSRARIHLSGLSVRLEKILKIAIQREVSRWESKLLVLATVASSAPYIGLFGTVWGIMTSFRSIAASKNTSLAVVAPGIAEALFATAIGLFAAIPAVIAYNRLQASSAKLHGRLEEFSEEFASVLSRQIDERTAHISSITTPLQNAS
jgi:biopolymer transport protein TolQ